MLILLSVTCVHTELHIAKIYIFDNTVIYFYYLSDRVRITHLLFCSYIVWGV